MDVITYPCPDPDVSQRVSWMANKRVRTIAPRYVGHWQTLDGEFLLLLRIIVYYSTLSAWLWVYTFICVDFYDALRNDRKCMAGWSHNKSMGSTIWYDDQEEKYFTKVQNGCN